MSGILKAQTRWGVWWEQRGLDVRSRNSPQAASSGAFVKLGDIKGEYRADDDAQGDAFVKLGDIKGEYRADDDAQGDAFVKLGDIKGEYRADDDAQGDAFVKLGDIKGEAYRADDDAQGDAFVKLGDIKGEAYADTRPQGHVDSSDIALLMSVLRQAPRVTSTVMARVT